jgi:AcrR family transcriptional regulator
MGNREELLAGAKRCLLEKGYLETTARDIAKAAGVSLAAIGYHFGSKDNLMNQAVYETIGEWGDSFGDIVNAVPKGAPPQERLEALWTFMAESFKGNRPLWVSQLELMMVAERRPEIKEFFAGVLPAAWHGLGALFQGIDEDDASRAGEATTAGKFYHTILIGAMAQWLLAPDVAATGKDLLEGLRLAAGNLAGGGGSAGGPGGEKPPQPSAS